MHKAEKTAQEWQFDSAHQPLSSGEESSQAVDQISEMIDYISDAGSTLGTFLIFIADICPEIADKILRTNFPVR